MGNAYPVCRTDERRANLHAPIDLPAVCADDLAAELLAEPEAELGLADCGGAQQDDEGSGGILV